MPKLRGIILDYDGTIADTLQDQFLWLKYCCEFFNKQFPYIEINKEFRKKHSDIWNEKDVFGLYEWFGINFYTNKQVIYDEFKKWKSNSQSPLFEGIKETIANIYHKSRPNEKKVTGLRIGINTSNTFYAIKKTLSCSGIIQYFDTIITRESIQSENLTKPNPYSIYKSLDALCVSADEAVSFGDMRKDIIACREPRVKTVAVTWGDDSKEDLEKEKPDFIINHPREIEDIVEKLGGFD